MDHPPPAAAKVLCRDVEQDGRGVRARQVRQAGKLPLKQVGNPARGVKVRPLRLDSVAEERHVPARKFDVRRSIEPVGRQGMARDDAECPQTAEEVERREPGLRERGGQHVGEPEVHVTAVDRVAGDQGPRGGDPEGGDVDRVAADVLEDLDGAGLVAWEDEEGEVVGGRDRGGGGDGAGAVGRGPVPGLGGGQS